MLRRSGGPALTASRQHRLRRRLAVAILARRPAAWARPAGPVVPGGRISARAHQVRHRLHRKASQRRPAGLIPHDRRRAIDALPVEDCAARRSLESGSSPTKAGARSLAVHALDLTGLNCPHVVLRLAEHMRGVPPGSRVTVVSTDPLSAIDVPFYLDKVGHLLVSRRRDDGRITFVIEAGVGGASG